MSDTATTPPEATAPSVGVAAPGAPSSATAPSWAAVVAHLVAALCLGSVAPYLVVVLAPGDALRTAPGGLELVDAAPGLVALAAISLALIDRLRPVGWLVAAAGLLGFAGLYVQGSTFDALTLTVLLIVTTALQFAGLLLAIAHASGLARWGIAVGLAAGIAGGRDAVALLVESVQSGIGDRHHGDDVVFGSLGVLIAIAAVVLLVVGRGRAGAGSTVSWSAVHWALGAAALAVVLAVGLSLVWDEVLDGIIQDYIGGMSDQDALKLQTWDQLARVGIAVLVGVILTAAARRWGGAGVARWVLVGLATGLAVPGVALQVGSGYVQSWLTVLLAAAGAVLGGVLVRRFDRLVPWEAPGLALATTMLFVDGSSFLFALGALGLGLALAAGVLQVGGSVGGVPSADGPGTAGVAVAVGLGLTGWTLANQVVVPSTAYRRTDLGGVDLVPYVMLLAAVVSVVFFLRSRRRTDGPGLTASRA